MTGCSTPAVRRFTEAREFYIDEGCHIRELSNTADDPGVSLAHARVEPGVVTRWHRLDGIIERYVILEGVGRVELGAEPPQIVQPGDVVLIPAGCPQRIANTGAAHLRFLAICTPRYRPEAYIDTDAEPPSFRAIG